MKHVLQKYRIPALSFGFVLAMVAVATVLRDSELILPEIGALTAGTWLYRKPTWIKQPTKLFTVPSGTAMIGFLINRLALAYALKVLIGLALMLIFMRVMRSNLAPAFATGLLPIIINATHWSFMVDIVFWTLGLMVGVYLQRTGSVKVTLTAINYRQMLSFCTLILIWVVAVSLAGQPQMAAIPPVVVVLFEMIQKPDYSARLALRQWVALTGAASSGVLLHLAGASWLVTVVIAFPVVTGLLALLKLKLPAAYAFPLLALVLPASMVNTLPLAAGLSAALFFTTLVLYRKLSPVIGAYFAEN